MSQVFISYSRKNTKEMYLVRDHLKAKGISVWVDTDNELEEWKGDIENGIKNCAALVVLMSPPAKESEYVKRELDIAKSYEKDLIPVFIDGDPNTSIPFLCRTLDYVDYKNCIGSKVFGHKVRKSMETSRLVDGIIHRQIGGAFPDVMPGSVL